MVPAGLLALLRVSRETLGAFREKNPGPDFSPGHQADVGKQPLKEEPRKGTQGADIPGKQGAAGKWERGGGQVRSQGRGSPTCDMAAGCHGRRKGPGAGGLSSQTAKNQGLALAAACGHSIRRRPCWTVQSVRKELFKSE